MSGFASPAKYRAIPSSGDEVYEDEVHEDEAGADPPCSINDSLADARVKWTYFLLGCAILLPWNALINGTSFFLCRLVGSPFHPAFSSYQSSVYTLSNLVAQVYCTITSKQSFPSRRIFVSVTITVLLVTSLFLSTFIRGTPSTFFSFVLFNSASLAITTAYLSTAVYAGAALLGASFLQTVLSGQAAVAVAVSVVQVASSSVSLWGSSVKTDAVNGGGDNQAEEIAARIFFGVSAAFLGFTLVAYTWLTRQSAYTSIVGILEQHHKVGDADELGGLSADHCRNLRIDANSHVSTILKQNLIFMFSIAYVFTVTLAVFPAVTVRVQSVNPDIHPLLFTAVHFLVFNIGDLVGRYTCSFPRLVVWSAKRILAMSLLRTLFIPLILLFNVHQPAATPPASPIISSDILFMLMLLTMGYTNGFVASLAMLAVSSLEHNPRLKGRREDVDVAATLGGSFVIVGLTAGAFSSFGVQAVICGCNPFTD